MNRFMVGVLSVGVFLMGMGFEASPTKMGVFIALVGAVFGFMQLSYVKKDHE